jgi:hypothetical protein
MLGSGSSMACKLSVDQVNRYILFQEHNQGLAL